MNDNLGLGPAFFLENNAPSYLNIFDLAEIFSPGQSAGSNVQGPTEDRSLKKKGMRS
jgi:hypothetical protein